MTMGNCSCFWILSLERTSTWSKYTELSGPVIFLYKAVDVSDISFQLQILKNFPFPCNSEKSGSSGPPKSGMWP